MHPLEPRELYTFTGQGVLILSQESLKSWVSKLSVVVDACNPTTWEAEARQSMHVQGQHSKTVSKRKTVAPPFLPMVVFKGGS